MVKTSGSAASLNLWITQRSKRSSAAQHALRGKESRSIGGYRWNCDKCKPANAFNIPIWLPSLLPSFWPQCLSSMQYCNLIHALPGPDGGGFPWVCDSGRFS
jgi:hypothetical protein